MDDEVNEVIRVSHIIRHFETRIYMYSLQDLVHFVWGAANSLWDTDTLVAHIQNGLLREIHDEDARQRVREFIARNARANEGGNRDEIDEKVHVFERQPDDLIDGLRATEHLVGSSRVLDGIHEIAHYAREIQYTQ